MILDDLELNTVNIYIQHVFHDPFSQDVAFLRVVRSKCLVVLQVPVSKLESRHDLAYCAAVDFSSDLIHPLQRCKSMRILHIQR